MNQITLRNSNSNNNGCSSNNEGKQRQMSRKLSRKTLERKSEVEYDNDDEINLINITSSVDEDSKTFEQNQDCLIDHTNEILNDFQENYLGENGALSTGFNNEEDEVTDTTRVNNLNSVFDELFAAAQSRNTNTTVSFGIKLPESASDLERRKSNSSTHSSSPPSATIIGKNESVKVLYQQQHNNSNSNLNMKKNFLTLKEAEGYLGSPQQLTRSCSCKRPGSFKKMRSHSNVNNSNQNQLTIKPRTTSEKIDDTSREADPVDKNNFSNSDEFRKLNKSSNRAGSLPFESLETNRNLDIYRLRCFNITPKGGIVNRGDSFKRSFKRSNRSVIDHNNLTAINDNQSPEIQSPQKQSTLSTPLLVFSHASDDGNLKTENDSFKMEEKEVPKSRKLNSKIRLYKNTDAEDTGEIDYIDTFVIYVLGSVGVGKNSLAKQFKTSEYHGTYAIDANVSVEEIEESVSVMLDGIESRLLFMPIDIENSKQFNSNYETLENYLSIQLINKNPIFELLKLTNDAYIVVYSVTDKASFLTAIDLLKTIRSNEIHDNYPIILVGNKSDLVRKRSITREEGQNLALKFNCKFVETSVAINDKVDDLLVGILKQIRLNFGIDIYTNGCKVAKNKNDENILHPLKEVIKTTIFEEKTNQERSDTKRKLKNKTNSTFDRKEKTKSKTLRRFQFFSKKQHSDVENIFDSSDSNGNTNNNYNNNSKRNLSFFHKIFTHIFKRKSKRSLLQSVENLYTPVVKKQNN